MPKLPRVSMARRKDNPEARMSVGEHLRELRNRLIISVIGILVGAVVGYLAYEWAFSIIAYPIENANARGADLAINFNTVLGSFDMRIRVSLWLGLILSSPLWMYEFWAFVGPGMTRREKMYTWAYGLAGLLLFAAGVGVGVFILPHAVWILTGFIPSFVTATGLIDASLYLSFVMRLVLVFGLAFLLPELMVALNQLGLVRGRTLLKGWRWAVVGIFALMAVANPLPDPWSMIFMALPICGLYFLACFIAVHHDKRVERRRARLDAELDAALADS
ncbi:twin-arginine translocase subunit TatC [Actinomyces sp. 2119]|uniref:Sec-independent protein translocase protein TatC n=1 Tax=Actinomyces lilanjuaniae TaxID=2321394 RepID=A0ABN5PN60_9ACTO|nr:MULTISPECIES: twin-arginine translocase subunit TatC [Actinomyces]AYD89790.1 twin-arginine translocase subunit TatC [Actinomyces lilanjuaniae]RJF44765.1 twin-arginine translocase subunit TatC [Actinomyces sp. 2119]